MQHALKREAIALVAAGVCDAETVDTVVKYGFGLRLPILGPLEQSDLIGLELTLAIHETLMPSLDVTPTAHPLLVEKVAQGKIGAKVGEGFRTWTPEEAQALQSRVKAYLVAAAKQRHVEESATAE
jgi:3-hydroxybutyryl-CoA dehydrogenase